MKVFIIICVLTVALFMWIYKISTYNNMFSEICRALQLNFSKGNIFQFPQISGSIEGCDILVKKKTKNRADYLNITSEKHIGISDYIRISKESVFNQIQRVIGIKDVETGDTDFDEKMCLAATYSSTLVALLDNKTRDRIINLSEHADSIDISNSNITVWIRNKLSLNSENLISIIQSIVSITKNLSDSTPIKKRLIQNMNSDPFPEVRIKNIQALTSQFPLDSEVREALSVALKDPDSAVIVEAARHLGQKGMKHLPKLLESPDTRLSNHLLIDIVEILKENNYTKSIPILEKTFQTREQTELKIIILQAFKTFGDESLNSFLIGELDKDQAGLHPFIIEALGTCGQVDAVEKLYKIGKSTLNPITRNEIKEAISRIQSRLGDVEKGWLSVTEFEDFEGALSIADQAGDGALSITEDKKGNPGKDSKIDETPQSGEGELALKKQKKIT